jgi:predicted Zn-dependent peptidase
MQISPSLHKISNGITVILDPMDIATTCVSLSVKTGGRDESDSELGITHFIEHMWLKGTPTHPSNKAIKDYIDGKGGFINAATGNSTVRIHGRILSENLNILIELIADLFRNSLFDYEVINNERSVILDELRRFLDDKERNFTQFQLYNLFNGSGIANITLGTSENIKSFSREQILNYIAKRISAKNTTIMISGKIDNPNNILSLLEKLFSWLPKFDISSNSAVKVISVTAHNLKQEQKQVMARICFKDMFPNTLENRFKNKCIARFNRILSKRLHEEVRNKNGLVYGIGIEKFGNETASVNSISFSSTPENLEKILSLSAHVSSDIINKNPPTKEEFDIVVMQEKLNDANWLESALSRRDGIQGFYQLYEKLFIFNEDVIERNRITLTDILENARDYFTEPLGILTQGPEFSINLKTVWENNFNC